MDVDKLETCVAPLTQQEFDVKTKATLLSAAVAAKAVSREYIHFCLEVYDVWCAIVNRRSTLADGILSRCVKNLIDWYWFARNAKRIVEYLDWTLSKFPDTVNVSKRTREELILAYCEGETTFARGGRPFSVHVEAESFHDRFGQLVSVVLLANSLMSVHSKVPATIMDPRLIQRLQLTMGVDATALTDLRESEKSRSTMVENWWWYEQCVYADRRPERQKCKWMYDVNKFLTDEYVALLDAVCCVFGVATTIRLSGDRAAWWKVKREDALAIASFVRCMNAEDKDDLSDVGSANRESGLAYRVPARVAKGGFYASTAERELDLSRLFHKIANHIRKGQRIVAWLTDKIERVTSALQSRVFIGGGAVEMTKLDLRELHESVIGSVTGVHGARCCTIRAPEVKHLFDHTQSESFAGMVQCLRSLLDRWDSTDDNLNRAYARVQEYCDRLCTLRISNNEEPMCDTVCKRHRPECRRMSDLDSFLDTLVHSDQLQWVRPTQGQSTTTPATDTPMSQASRMELTDRDFKLIVSMYPMRLTSGSDRVIHGVYHERDLVQPIRVLPPVSHRIQDCLRINVCEWTLPLNNITPVHLPRGLDRLCRRRYRPLLIALSSGTAAKALVQRYVHKHASESDRPGGLEDLCEGGTDELMASRRYFAGAYWKTESKCMREERSLSARTNTLGDHTGLMEFIFWLREFITANRRWVRQSNILPSESPRAHDSVVDAHRADVFAVFPDEFRIAFKCSDAGVSNCVQLASDIKSSSEERFIHYRLEADCRVDTDKLMRAMRVDHPTWEWFYHVDAIGGKHFRIRNAPNVDLLALIGADNVSASFSERGASDVRQPEFVPGATLFTDSLGKFARFVFWGLVQSMATDEDKAWSALVPSDPLHNLPYGREDISNDLMNDGDDARSISAADPCWREYLFWVTVELQRIVLLMKPCNMGPRISGAGLQIMSADRIYNGNSVASILFNVQHSKKERTKKVVRPNSYLNSRCVSILANAGCVYFPFHSQSILSLCQNRLGFVRSPGYDPKRYPYFWKVIVDSKGDLRDDVPICFGSPLIGHERFSDFVWRLSSCAGYSKIKPFEGSIDAELKLARIVNTYGYSRMGISFSTNGSRKRGNSLAVLPREATVFTSATERMEFTATSVSKLAFSNDIMLSRRTDDRHSTQSVGVAHPHYPRDRAAQLGDRYMFCDVQQDGTMVYRSCIGDTFRRVCMGFSEQSMTLWDDLCGTQVTSRTHPPVYPEASYSSEAWLNTLRMPASSPLENLRHLIVPEDGSESTTQLNSELSGIGWTALSVDYERGSCTVWAKADKRSEFPNDFLATVLSMVHRCSTADAADDREIFLSVFSLLVRFQTTSLCDYLESNRGSRTDLLCSYESSRSTTVAAVSELADCGRMALEKAIVGLQGISCDRSARLLELSGMLISAMDTGRTNANAISRSPRAVSRWIKLTGNVYLLTKCLRTKSRLPDVETEDDLRSVLKLLNGVMDMCDQIVMNLSCSISDECETIRVRELSTLFDTSEGVSAEDEHLKHWLLCSSRCLSHLSLFYLHEDLLYGGQIPVEDASFEPAEDNSCFEGGVVDGGEAPDPTIAEDEENTKKMRCSRQQIRTIMDACGDSESTDTGVFGSSFLHASGITSKHVWTDAVSECILLSDLSYRTAEGKTCVHDAHERTRDSATRSEEADSEISQKVRMSESSCEGGVTMNDICFSSVCRSLHTQGLESRLRRSEQLYRIDFAIRTLGQAAECWSVCRDVVDMSTPETQSGFFHMYEVRIPDTVHEDLEKQWLRCDSAGNRKVIVEVAVQKEEQVVYSTRLKPFRFLLDEVLTQHVDMRSMADNFGCVYFPRMARCDLVTNEKRTLRHKDGAAGVLISSHGRVQSFRFMASALILNRDVDMLDV
ncbi:hypothetical protein CYMTET_44629 [Cymbomonas tetramitiformis]|uniref:Uncharacterized protein n=1 Tax=Cymbomonas tetramitiformis TaxID=36881 RepID=A0AAE0C105_9CHLO|nr:hypothetical protein CYMTET_44629 [Cymbomonas tetramitiformis]|eukprot:gene8023-9533_t